MRTKTEIRIKRPLNQETGEADCPQCGSAKSVARHNADWTCYKCGYCEIVDDDREAERPWMAGDKLLCIDDQGWLVPDPGHEHLSPQKGRTYTLREYTREAGVAAVSLREGNIEHFYRACRFKRVGQNAIGEPAAGSPTP